MKFIKYKNKYLSKILKYLNKYELLKINYSISNNKLNLLKKIKKLNNKNINIIMKNIYKFLGIYHFNIIYYYLQKNNKINNILKYFKIKNDNAMKIQLFWLSNSFLYTLNRYNYIQSIDYSYHLNISNLNNIRNFKKPDYKIFIRRKRINYEFKLNYSKINNNAPASIDYSESTKIILNLKCHKKLNL